MSDDSARLPSGQTPTSRTASASSATIRRCSSSAPTPPPERAGRAARRSDRQGEELRADAAAAAEQRRQRRYLLKALLRSPTFMTGLIIVALLGLHGALLDLHHPGPVRAGRHGVAQGRRAPPTGSAPTTSGATCSPAPWPARAPCSSSRRWRPSLALFWGSIIGLIAGFWRGLTDDVIMRLIDVLLALPIIVTSILILSLLGARASRVMILTIGILFTPVVSRTVRAAVIGEREREYVLAARLRGERSAFVMAREILPNITQPIIVEGTVRLGYAVFTAATLWRSWASACSRRRPTGASPSPRSGLPADRAVDGAVPGPRPRVPRGGGQPHHRRTGKDVLQMSSTENPQTGSTRSRRPRRQGPRGHVPPPRPPAAGAQGRHAQDRERRGLRARRRVRLRQDHPRHGGDALPRQPTAPSTTAACSSTARTSANSAKRPCASGAAARWPWSTRTRRRRSVPPCASATSSPRSSAITRAWTRRPPWRRRARASRASPSRTRTRRSSATRSSSPAASSSAS